MKLKITARARQSIRSAVAWYRQEGGIALSTKAAKAFKDAAQSAADNPMQHTAYEPVPPVRRVVMDRFPYLVFYLLEGDFVVIIDVLHTSMKPPKAFHDRHP